jgi:hypothetical protein
VVPPLGDSSCLSILPPALFLPTSSFMTFTWVSLALKVEGRGEELEVVEDEEYVVMGVEEDVGVVVVSAGGGIHRPL